MSRPVDARGGESPAVPDGDELLAKVPGADDFPVSAALVAVGFVVVVVPEDGQPGVVVEVVVVVEPEPGDVVEVVEVEVVEVVELVEVVEVLVDDDVDEVVVVVVDGQLGDVVEVVVVDASVDTADLSAGLAVTVQQGEATLAAARS
jgi:hypothetical protein